MKLIETHKLCKKYSQGATEIHALVNININIYEQETIAVVGKSGSGKSTLLHILGGLDTPTQGDVIIDSVNVATLSENEKCKFRRKNIGFVFQSYNLIPELNIKENIQFPVLLTKTVLDEQYINELIYDMGLQERIYHLPNQLSGGEQQRVAIARALAGKPKIVMCDEPTGNLDEETGQVVLNKLIDIKLKYKQTILIVTHDNDIANKMDRTITLSHGKIIKDSKEVGYT